MGLFLFIIGFLGSIICILWFVVNLIRKKKFKKQGIGIFIGLIIMLFGLTMPRSEEEVTVMLEEEKVNYSQLEEMIESKQANLLEIEEKIKDERDKFKKEVDSKNKELESKKEEYQEVVALIDKKDKIEVEIKTANDKLSDIQSELDKQLKDGKASIEEKLKESQTKLADVQEKVETLSKELESKKKELSTIEGGIKEKKDAPKILPAGYFAVGKDIPAGRYKVVAVGRGSNLFIYDSAGETIVNTIISNKEGHGVKEYVIGMGDGFMIEANDSFKYIPVE